MVSTGDVGIQVSGKKLVRNHRKEFQMNKVILTGNLARDPEYKTTKNGIETCTFTVACGRNYKNAEGNYDVDFINCVAWRQTAAFIHNYFHKGSGIGVEGSVKTESWEKDGKKYYKTVVYADNVEFGKNGAKNGSSAETPAKVSETREENAIEREMREQGYDVIDDPELPF